MGQLPSGIPSNRISAIGSIRLPMKPTLNSRPATYSCTRTSSNCSSIWATRRLSARLEVQTAPLSMPTLASSAAGLTMAGSGNSAGLLLAWARVKAGTGRPAAASSVLATCFRWAMVVAQCRQPVKGTPVSSSVPDDEVFVAGVAVDPFAEIEDQVGPPDAGEPAEVAEADGKELHLVAPPPENVPDLVDVAHAPRPRPGDSTRRCRHRTGSPHASGYLRQE